MPPTASPAADGGDQTTQPSRPLGNLVAIVAAAVFLICALIGGGIVLTSDQGQVVIQSDLAEAKLTILQDGKKFSEIDVRAGSQAKWLPAGQYEAEVSSNREAVDFSKQAFKLTPWGKATLVLKHKAAHTVATNVAHENRVLHAEPSIPDPPRLGPALPLSAPIVTAPAVAVAVPPQFPVLVPTTVFSGHTAAVTRAVFVPNSRTILTASLDRSLRQWDLDSGKELKSHTGHNGWIWGLAVSADGLRALTGSEDRTIKVWDLATGQSQTLTGHAGVVTSVAFWDQDCKAISTSWDKTVRIWNLTSLECEHTLEGHTNSVWDVVVTPDQQRAVTCSADKTLRVWDLTTHESLRTIVGHDGLIGLIDVSADGSSIVSGSEDGTVRVWKLDTGEQLSLYRGHRQKVQGVAFSPDGKQVASSNYSGEVILIDVATGGELARVVGPPAFGADLQYSKDGKQILAGFHDGTATIWQVSLNGSALFTGNWTPLFNGKDLADWEPLWPEHGSWKVENGLLVGRSPPNQLLTKRQDFSDFHLRAEFRINATGNSGLFFRCQESRFVPRPGYEMELGFGEPQKTGSLMVYGQAGETLRAETRELIQPDVWQIVEVIAYRNGLTTKVNGETVAFIANNAYQTGRIELQVFGGASVVEFRKIEILENKRKPVTP